MRHKVGSAWVDDGPATPYVMRSPGAVPLTAAVPVATISGWATRLRAIESADTVLRPSRGMKR